MEGNFWFWVCTVPVKGKLTDSIRFLKLDSRVVKVKMSEFQDVRIETQGSRVEK